MGVLLDRPVPVCRWTGQAITTLLASQRHVLVTTGSVEHHSTLELGRFTSLQQPSPVVPFLTADHGQASPLVLHTGPQQHSCLDHTRQLIYPRPQQLPAITVIDRCLRTHYQQSHQAGGLFHTLPIARSNDGTGSKPFALDLTQPRDL